MSDDGVYVDVIRHRSLVDMTTTTRILGERTENYLIYT